MTDSRSIKYNGKNTAYLAHMYNYHGRPQRGGGGENRRHPPSLIENIKTNFFFTIKLWVVF